MPRSVAQNDRRSSAGRGARTTAPAPSPRVLRVLQITDLHLYADAAGRLLGQNTRETLDLVLNLAIQVCWPIDRLLLTGDLVHDESARGYRYLEQRIARLGIPCNGIPGNHDAPQLMSEIFNRGRTISTATSVRAGTWRLVFLDSTIPHDNGGHLSDGQLDRLREDLAAHPHEHTLVCLHHQPVPVGSRWVDTMALDNPDDFFSVTDQHPQVRGVLWGHVHQEFSSERRGVGLFAAPSTCVQFLPGSEDFAVDALTPGFRWLDLHPDGRIDTGVQRIAAYPAPVDLTTAGY